MESKELAALRLKMQWAAAQNRAAKLAEWRKACGNAYLFIAPQTGHILGRMDGQIVLVSRDQGKTWRSHGERIDAEGLLESLRARARRLIMTQMNAAPHRQQSTRRERDIVCSWTQSGHSKSVRGITCERRTWYK